MKDIEYCPDRGDIIWIDFNPHLGHEQSGRRPAIVLSPFEYNKKVGLALVCPITKQLKGYTFEVLLPENIQVSGVIISDQIKSLAWKERNVMYIGKLPQIFVEETIKKIKTLLLL